MTLYMMTWPDRTEVAVLVARTQAHAMDRMRDGRIVPWAKAGPPRCEEFPESSVVMLTPQAAARVEAFLGVAGHPDPRFVNSPREAWLDFQEGVGELLDRYPVLSGLVPPAVRAAWLAGQTSILEVLVEVVERAVPEVDLETSQLKAARGGG